jgi:hypothetical protein
MGVVCSSALYSNCLNSNFFFQKFELQHQHFSSALKFAIKSFIVNQVLTKVQLKIQG